jgi:hypothetical protein
MVIVEGDAWKRAFVATTIALGDSLEESLAAMGEDAAAAHAAAHPAAHSVAQKPLPNVIVALVNGLRSTSKSMRATALAEPLRDIMLAIDEATLL